VQWITRPALDGAAFKPQFRKTALGNGKAKIQWRFSRENSGFIYETQLLDVHIKPAHHASPAAYRPFGWQASRILMLRARKPMATS
jgi:hypothetical protein